MLVGLCQDCDILAIFYGRFAGIVIFLQYLWEVMVDDASTAMHMVNCAVKSIARNGSSCPCK